MRRPILQSAVLVLLLTSTPIFRSAANAQPDGRAEKIQRYLQHLDANNKFMGSVALSIDGKQIVDTQVGMFANSAQAKLKPDADTQYRIGSISKTFTAVMILQLVEEGKLSLDTKLAKFFPDLNNADTITIEQLLRHRSGLGSITADPTYRSWSTQPKTRPEMLQIIARQPTRFKPDERARYSNTNYLLLGYIIEDLSGNSYADELKTRIVDRIGLKRTAYATKADEDANVAISFTWSSNQWTPRAETDPSIPHGAGSVMSTPSDLIVFIESLFAGKLVSEASLTKMTTMVDRMGMGIMQVPFGSRKAFSHNGGIDGFQSSLGYFPEDHVAIAMIGNGFNYGMNDVMIGLLSIAFERDFAFPSFETVGVDAAKLKRYEGTYASELIPLKITVSVKDGQLTAQATGQSAFPLTPTSDVEFKFDAAGVVISFNESKQGSGFDSLLLKQAGQNIEFEKEDE
jgi:D-alanyl-D-alanine carboxypeptidase